MLGGETFGGTTQKPHCRRCLVMEASAVPLRATVPPSPSPLYGNPTGLGPDPPLASTGSPRALSMAPPSSHCRKAYKVELRADPFTRSFSHISYIFHSYSAFLKSLLPSTLEHPGPWFYHPGILYSSTCKKIQVNEQKTGSLVRLKTITIDKEEKGNVTILFNLKKLERCHKCSDFI